MAHPTRIFKEPEDLLEAWKAYKKSLKEESKKWGKVQYVGKDGVRREDYPMMPYSLSGFKVFCYEPYGCVNQYFVNQDEHYTDFITICSRVKEEIRANQITGGMLGFFNPSITQRLNGLKDHQEVSGGQNIKVLTVDPLSDTPSESE